MAEYIDNSKLVPKWVPDEEVKLENGTPEWTKGLIIMQCRISNATPEGTLQSAVKVLDHCSEMGVNCLMVCPVNDRGIDGNGYTNLGPHTIDPKITGCDNYDDGWKVFRNFVDEAHKRNIRILLDVISWGVLKNAPLIDEHYDWFNGEAWKNIAFDWKNEEFKKWYIDTIVNIALKTDIDGFRYDVEPHYAGYDVDLEIKSRLLGMGKKMLMMSEDMNDRRDSYDIEQNGVKDSTRTFTQIYKTAIPIFVDMYNIVDCIKNGENIGSARSARLGIGGTYRYYTNCICNHDYRLTAVNGNRLILGYQAIMAPFIPLWYIGEEWNNPANDELLNDGILYINTILWDKRRSGETKEFFEDIKKLIKIRRTYKEIFEYWPENHRETNICKFNVEGTGLQSYARYYDNKAVLVIPNHTGSESQFKVSVPLEEMNMTNYKTYVVTNLLDDKVICKGSKKDILDFYISVKPEYMGIVLVEGSNE